MLKLDISQFNRLVHEEDGQNLIEYALVAGFLAIGAIAALTALKTQINALFTSVSNTLRSAI